MRGVFLLVTAFLGNVHCFLRHLHPTSPQKEALLKISSFDINILPKEEFKKRTLEETSDQLLALTKYSLYILNKIYFSVYIIKYLVV